MRPLKHHGKGMLLFGLLLAPSGKVALASITGVLFAPAFGFVKGIHSSSGFTSDCENQITYPQPHSDPADYGGNKAGDILDIGCSRILQFTLHLSSRGEPAQGEARGEDQLQATSHSISWLLRTVNLS